VRLRALAPAKVNLCLFLGPIRADCRHELVTLLESVSLADELELSTLAAGDDHVICPGLEGPNLVTAALGGLRARGWSAPPVRIEIRKRIPIAAGMGGGSADAAATLRLASDVAPVATDALVELAAALGADVPSQLVPGVSLATGAGDVVEPRPALAPHAFVIVPQPVGLSTAEVYREADRLGLPRPADELASRRCELVAELANGELSAGMLVNDLQPAALSLAPQIAVALDAALSAGAEHTTVCGSGPTVAGLFRGTDAEERAQAVAADLGRRYPGAAATAPVTGSPALLRAP
jgi:4-diphosphocytidyl-2-C-methyl-D-erythritol kinase